MFCIMPRNIHGKGESPYIVTFLEFYFYFGVIPFRIIYNTCSQEYCLKTYKLHRIWCAFSHMGCISFLLYSAHLTLLRLDNKTANESTVIAVIFETTSTIFNILSNLILVHCLFRKEAEIIKLVEGTRLYCTAEKSRKVKIWVSLTLMGASLVMVGIFSASFIVLNFSRIDVASKYYALQITFSVFTCILLFQFSYMFVISFVMIMGLFLAMGQMANDFQHRMSSLLNSRDGIKLGRAMYSDLKRTTRLCQEIFGSLLFTIYMSYICYLIEFPYVFLSTQTHGAYKATTLFFFVIGMLWNVAAEFHKTIQSTVQEWAQFYIYNHRMLKWEDIFRLATISSEISSDTISISSKYLSVTYSSIGSMIGVILTYSIVIFQLNPR